MTLTAIDQAYEHCLWAKRAGLTPWEVIRSVGGALMRNDNPSWLDALQAVKVARMTLGAPKAQRAAA